MTKESLKYQLINALLLMTIATGMLLTVTEQSNKSEKNLKTLKSEYGAFNENIEKLQSEIAQKEKDLTRKISILEQAEKITNYDARWSVIFNISNQNNRSINLYGIAKTENDKKQLLSLISNISDIYLIRENITVTSNRPWPEDDKTFLAYNPEKDVMRKNVVVQNYSDKEFTALANLTEEQKTRDTASNGLIKYQIEQAFFSDPTLYPEVTDIKVKVDEMIPEVTGIVSSNNHKERITQILEDFTTRDRIVTFINSVQSQEENLEKEKKMKSGEDLKNIRPATDIPLPETTDKKPT